MKTSVSITRRKQTTLISRKSRRLRRKCSLRREYKKLRSLLPRTIKSPDLRHKVGVVDAAYQYIRHLQTALLDKFSSRGIPPDLAGIVGDKVTSAEDVQALALYLIRQNNNNNLPDDSNKGGESTIARTNRTTATNNDSEKAINEDTKLETNTMTDDSQNNSNCSSVMTNGSDCSLPHASLNGNKHTNGL